MAPCRLLHDASEYVIGDMITPFKALGTDIRRLSSGWKKRHIRFDLPAYLRRNTDGDKARTDVCLS